MLLLLLVLSALHRMDGLTTCHHPIVSNIDFVKKCNFARIHGYSKRLRRVVRFTKNKKKT